MQHHDSSTPEPTNVDNKEVSSPSHVALDRCQQELQEYKEKFLRLSADFENSKRRQEKERLQWSRMAQVDVLKGLLDIVDNFERALHGSASEESEHQGMLAGFDLIYKELLKYLQSVGIEPLSDQPTFDPEIHEAVSTVEHAELPSGSIAHIYQKGYRFKGTLLRPAKVSIVQ